MINKIILSDVNLESADNGDTTYYGGSFSLKTDDDECEFMFVGNDRSTSPEETIIYTLDQMGFAYDEKHHDQLWNGLETFMSGTDETLTIYYDETNGFTLDV